MTEMLWAISLLLVVMVGVLVKEEYKCYKRRKERLNNGDTLEFM